MSQQVNHFPCSQHASQQAQQNTSPRQPQKARGHTWGCVGGRACGCCCRRCCFLYINSMALWSQAIRPIAPLGRPSAASSQRGVSQAGKETRGGQQLSSPSVPGNPAKLAQRVPLTARGAAGLRCCAAGKARLPGAAQAACPCQLGRRGVIERGHYTYPEGAGGQDAPRGHLAAAICGPQQPNILRKDPPHVSTPGLWKRPAVAHRAR